MNHTTVDERLSSKLQELCHNLRSVIRGKEEIIEDVIVALVAGGSVLIEDVPV